MTLPMWKLGITPHDRRWDVVRGDDNSRRGSDDSRGYINEVCTLLIALSAIARWPAYLHHIGGTPFNLVNSPWRHVAMSSCRDQPTSPRFCAVAPFIGHCS
jgi:hypothetical protein